MEDSLWNTLHDLITKFHIIFIVNIAYVNKNYI
jgi:hypothetical protein